MRSRSRTTYRGAFRQANASVICCAIHFGGRMRGHSQPPKLPASMQQPTRDRRYDEQVHRSNAIGMIDKEGLPPLGGWAPSLRHVLRNGGLPEIDAELE